MSGGLSFYLLDGWKAHSGSSQLQATKPKMAQRGPIVRSTRHSAEPLQHIQRTTSSCRFAPLLDRTDIKTSPRHNIDGIRLCPLRYARVSPFVCLSTPSGARLICRPDPNCGAQTPSLRRGVPVLPARVPCSVCGTKRVYRPSEVFIGNPPRIWKQEAMG
jgi:hypothetical protein